MENEEKKTAEELTSQEVPAVDEVVNEVPAEEVVEEQTTSDSEVEEKPAEKVETTEEQPSDDTVSGEVDSAVEEEPTTDNNEVEVTEKPTTSDSEVEEVKEEVSIDELKAKIAELEKEKAERASIDEDIESEKVVEETTRKATIEFQAFNNRLAIELEKQLKTYSIPMDKTVEELQKEDPTKAAILNDLINTAQHLQAQEQARITENVRNSKLGLIFKKAEKLFAKHEMTPEQQDVAANTFVNIIGQSGVNDLKEDLQAKVELSVAQAKFSIPDVVEHEVSKVEEPAVVEEAPVDTTVENTSPEISEETEPATNEVETEIPPTPTIDIEAFKEGIAGNSVGNVQTVNENNVLQKLNSLPFKERQAFYKEHADIINRACKTQFENKGNK